MEKVHKIKWNLNIRFEVKSLSNSKIRISRNIDENIARYKEIFAECADIKMRTMLLGANKRTRCFLAYIEVAVSNTLLENTALGRLLGALEKIPEEKMVSVLDANALGIVDATPY